jgi:hypothetical protein
MDINKTIHSRWMNGREWKMREKKFQRVSGRPVGVGTGELRAASCMHMKCICRLYAAMYASRSSLVFGWVRWNRGYCLLSLSPAQTFKAIVQGDVRDHHRVIKALLLKSRNATCRERVEKKSLNWTRSEVQWMVSMVLKAQKRLCENSSQLALPAPFRFQGSLHHHHMNWKTTAF